MFVMAYTIIIVYMIGLVYFIRDSSKEAKRDIKIKEARRQRG
jgi:hypothetical protein